MPPTLHQSLTEFTGIGDVGADFFRREVQGVWDEYAPFVDDRAASSAAALDVPAQAADLYELVDGPETFARLVAALVRADMGSGAKTSDCSSSSAPRAPTPATTRRPPGEHAG